jgi:hypothetical protein
VAAAPSGTPSPLQPERHLGLRLPFWGLQAAELLIALALVDVAVHLDHAWLLLFAAGALGLLALSARGPLGIVRVCPPRAHAVLCVVVAALVLTALVLTALVVPALRPGAAGIATLALAMLGLVRLATLTRTDAGPLPRGVWPAQVIDASATVAHDQDSAQPPPTRPVPAASGPPVQGVGSAPSASPDGSTTDRLARLAGEAVATGQKAARRHRPAIEAGARRGIRSLGRAVGRMGR